MFIIQKILPVLLSLAVVILGIRILKGHFVTVSLAVATLWLIRNLWRKKRRNKPIASKGGEALVHGLATDIEKIQRWITKSTSVLSQLEAQQEQDGEATGTEFNRADLIQTQTAYLESLRSLKEKFESRRKNLESAILTYRTLIQGYRSDKSLPRNSEAAEIRKKITSMEKNIRQIRSQLEKLNGETHEKEDFDKILKSLQ